MFGSKILPAILIIVPATVLVSVQASLSEPAAEECKTSPGTNAPRGAHWYYRVNRAKQHCWYLGVVDGHAHAQAVTPATSTCRNDTAEKQCRRIGKCSSGAGRARGNGTCARGGGAERDRASLVRAGVASAAARRRVS